MTDRKTAHETAEKFFDDIWKRGDFWELESSSFERDKYDREIQMLTRSHYGNVLEIGCGAWAFTRRLAPLAGRIVALDVSPAAISRARQAGADLTSVDFRVQNIMDVNLRAEGTWDLVVMNETICYLGWLYSFFDVAWFASELFHSTQPGGQLLMANTCGGTDDYLMIPPLIRTYHDLFVNVGYEESETVFRGTKNGADLDVIISLFTKQPAP